MRKHILVFLTIYFLLTSCEFNDDGDIGISDFGWLIIAGLIMGFLYIITRSDKDRKETSAPYKRDISDIEYANMLENIPNEYRDNLEFIYKDEKYIEFQVSGVFYRSKSVKEDIPYLTASDEVKLTKEPNNQYDKFAVKVMLGRRKAGYVPKDYAEQVTRLINEDRILKTYISEAGDNGDLYDPNPYFYIKIFHS